MSIKSHGTLRGALRAEVPWQKLYEHRHQHSVLGGGNQSCHRHTVNAVVIVGGGMKFAFCTNVPI